MIGSDARSTVVYFKRSTQLLTVNGITTEHADCRITFKASIPFNSGSRRPGAREYLD